MTCCYWKLCDLYKESAGGHHPFIILFLPAKAADDCCRNLEASVTVLRKISLILKKDNAYCVQCFS